MKPVLIDNHGREVSYLRLAVTDRCNLRCFYCMPEEGIKYVAKDDLLTYEEMLRFSSVMAGIGIKKIRITGGEPFVRKDMIDFIEKLSKIEGIEGIHLTTNGTTTRKHLPRLKELGLKSINLSLDTLDPKRFHEITRRNEFDNVMETFHAILDSGITLKVNAVVMEGRNTDDIIPFVQFTEKLPFEIRFIEEMPFNGSGRSSSGATWDHVRILETIKTAFPNLAKSEDPQFATASGYKVPGFAGSVGIIAAYSRTFCGTCNRLRMTPQGTIKTCLYDNGVFNVRDLMRKGASDEQLVEAILSAVSHRARDGREAEKRSRILPISESMSTIGG